MASINAINTHGININMDDLEACALETSHMPKGWGCFIQISYDLSNGCIISDRHWSKGRNPWTVHHNPNIIGVACAYSPKTMQEIADVIAKAVANH